VAAKGRYWLQRLRGRTANPDRLPLGACDFFDLSVFGALYQMCFNPSKTVILSEAPRRSIANRGFYGAKSKDFGDAYWQMLFRAFWPQTTKELKKSQALGMTKERGGGS
jgi:hypothetical protein